MKKILFYLLPLLLFTIDIFFLGLFQQEIISTLLCFYGVLLVRSTKTNLLILYLYFLSAISLILYGTFALPLLYLLPLSLLALGAKKNLNKTFWLPYALVGLSLLAQEILTSLFLFQIFPNTLFTGAKLCVNLTLVLIIDKSYKT